MRRPLVFLAVGAALLVAAAVPARSLEVTPGSLSALPELARGGARLRAAPRPRRRGRGHADADRHRRGRSRRARSRPGQSASTRLVDDLFHDPEALIVATRRRATVRRSDRTLRARGRRRPARVRRRARAGSSCGACATTLVPRARFPAGARVYAGGAPPQGVDFLDALVRRVPVARRSARSR